MSLIASYSNLTQAPMPLPVTQLVGNGTLDASATFTRLTDNASYFDATPTMQYADANVPRWDHDPLTGAPLGLLIEQQDTNYITQSETYSGWGVANCSVASDPSTFFGRPYTQVITSAVNGSGAIYVGAEDPSGPGTRYLTFAVRAGTAIQANAGINDSLGWGPVTKQVVFGPAALAGNGPVTITQMSAVDSLVSIARNVTASNTGTSVLFYPASDNPSTVGAYTLLSRMMLSNSQGSYIPTNGAAITRAEDVLTYPAPAAAGTILLDHDAAAGASLINTNSTDILTSQGAGKIAIAWDASGTSVCYNGGAVTTGAAITWGSDYELLKNANAHIKPNGALLHLRKLSDAELQAATA